MGSTGSNHPSGKTSRRRPPRVLCGKRERVKRIAPRPPFFYIESYQILKISQRHMGLQNKNTQISVMLFPKREEKGRGKGRVPRFATKTYLHTCSILHTCDSSLFFALCPTSQALMHTGSSPCLRATFAEFFAYFSAPNRYCCTEKVERGQEP